MLAFLALLSGCTTIAPHSDEKLWSGRFSVRVRYHGKTEVASGGWRLRQSADSQQLEILSPLKGILGRVRVTSSQALLERPNKPDVIASNAQSLMTQAFGFSLPINMLASWLEGLPLDTYEAERVSNDRFEQAGWIITVRARNEEGAPSNIIFERLESPVDAGITMVVTITRNQRQ